MALHCGDFICSIIATLPEMASSYSEVMSQERLDKRLRSELRCLGILLHNRSTLCNTVQCNAQKKIKPLVLDTPKYRESAVDTGAWTRIKDNWGGGRNRSFSVGDSCHVYPGPAANPNIDFVKNVTVNTKKK